MFFYPASFVILFACLGGVAADAVTYRVDTSAIDCRQQAAAVKPGVKVNGGSLLPYNHSDSARQPGRHCWILPLFTPVTLPRVILSGQNTKLPWVKWVPQASPPRLNSGRGGVVRRRSFRCRREPSRLFLECERRGGAWGVHFRQRAN
jgi:hypothetical protein